MLSANFAMACSFQSAKTFVPTPEKWTQHPGPAQTKPGSNGDYWEKIPKPIVRITKISRGKAAIVSSCDDIGMVRIAVSLPSTTTYAIEEFGIYFRAKSGRDPYNIIPDIPLAADAVDGVAKVLFVWVDGTPSIQQAIDLEIEVFSGHSWPQHRPRHHDNDAQRWRLTWLAQASHDWSCANLKNTRTFHRTHPNSAPAATAGPCRAGARAGVHGR